MAEIWYDEATGAWLAEMGSTSYAFGLADGGAALRHLHWGGRCRAKRWPACFRRLPARCRATSSSSA